VTAPFCVLAATGMDCATTFRGLAGKTSIDAARNGSSALAILRVVIMTSASVGRRRVLRLP
jgi:hypothetical protein